MSRLKLNPQLMCLDSLEMEDNNKSLRERYGEEKKAEIKIEPKSVLMAKRVWNLILTGVGTGFAIIGLTSLIHPLLRARLIVVFLHFFAEAGLLRW